jgi:hypothetical protein
MENVMNPARGKPGRIADATHNTRIIYPTVRTCRMTSGHVMATFSLTQDGVDPFTTHVYGRLKLVGRRWRCSFMLQALADDEQDALRTLRDILNDHLAPEREPALDAIREVLVDWLDWSALPWEQQPMGLRKHKPRRERLWRTDPHTGAGFKIYKDTGARYAHEPSIYKKTKGRKTRPTEYTTNPKDITR